MKSDFLTTAQLSIELQRLAEQAERTVCICSAYCRSAAFREIFSAVSDSVTDRRLLFRWRFDDLISGASDIEAYYDATRLGWKVYLNFDLHVKCYLFDKYIVIGSANLTRAGIFSYPGSNIELCAVHETSVEQRMWVDELFGQSILLTDDIVNSIQNDLRYCETDKQYGPESFSGNTIALLEKQLSDLLISIDEFPWTHDPESVVCRDEVMVADSDALHDRLLFLGGQPGEMDILRASFIRSRCFLWLLGSVGQEAYFGELSHLLHNQVSAVPKSSRKDIKRVLKNLLSWASILAPDILEIDRPSYSQRVRVK